MVVTIIIFILILSLLVFIHEAGHFFVAKRMGVKVEEFGFGFPPRLVGKKIGETIYSINALPMGGFVKLYGEDEAGGGRIKIAKTGKAHSKEKNRAFFAKSPWQRAAIVFAGVCMNFLLSVFIATYVYAVIGISVPGKNVLVEDIAKNSPAEKAGIHAGDLILAVDQTPIVTPQQLIEYTKNHQGHEITVTIQEKHHTTEILRLTPRTVFPKNEGAMGVVITTNSIIKKYPWYTAPVVGTWDTLKNSWMLLQGLGHILQQLIVQKTIPQGVAGPIGIAQLTGQVIAIGPEAVLALISLISLNLAVINILPIPALDGGRLAFILFEAFTGKKINQKFEGYVNAAGMALLLFLFVLISFHDIVRLINHQPLFK